jgi:Zn ribbon nucleic-acid-binding protein
MADTELTLTPVQQLELAKKGLRHIWNRWRKEDRAARREELWPLVVEAEHRLEQAKMALGMLEEGVCPECQNEDLFKFKDEDGLVIILCKKCGWGNRDDLLGIIRDTARRIKNGES